MLFANNDFEYIKTRTRLVVEVEDAVVRLQKIWV